MYDTHPLTGGRKLVLQMQMSVDGYFGAAGPHDWQLWNWDDGGRWDDELKRDFSAHMQTVDTILLSSRMMEDGYLNHWSRMAEFYPRDPFFAFAQRIVELPKVVPSRSLRQSKWERTSIANWDLASVVGDLKAQPGGNIGVFGGAGLASALIAEGLVDELQLYTNPAVLGGGSRIFDRGGFNLLTLLGSKTYASGMVVSRYAPGQG